MAKQFSPEEKELMILDFKKSGAKPRDFAGHLRISYQSLTKWIKIYDQYGIKGLSQPKIQENNQSKKTQK